MNDMRFDRFMNLVSKKEYDRLQARDRFIERLIYQVVDYYYNNNLDTRAQLDENAKELLSDLADYGYTREISEACGDDDDCA